MALSVAPDTHAKYPVTLAADSPNASLMYSIEERLSVRFEPRKVKQSEA